MLYTVYGLRKSRGNRKYYCSNRNVATAKYDKNGLGQIYSLKNDAEASPGVAKDGNGRGDQHCNQRQLPQSQPVAAIDIRCF